jgi:SAM-dependent methyltransferase
MKYIDKLNDLGFYEAFPKPSIEELTQYYSDKYWQNSREQIPTEYSPDEIRLFNNHATVAKEIAINFDLDKKLLDLGCGQGYFTKYFHTSGWDIVCCDFSEFGIQKHNSDMRPFFMAGDICELIEKFKSSKDKYGLINLQDVLEHVVDTVNLLISLKPLFSGQSALRIVVPNDYSDFQKALLKRGDTKNTWFAPPDHLSYFNKKGLINMLEFCGYSLLSLQADFPIEIFLANEHSNYVLNKNLGRKAHLARVFCENHLIESDIKSYIQYAEAMGNLGFGRQLIAYVTPAC